MIKCVRPRLRPKIPPVLWSFTSLTSITVGLYSITVGLCIKPCQTIKPAVLEPQNFCRSWAWTSVRLSETWYRQSNWVYCLAQSMIVTSETSWRILQKTDSKKSSVQVNRILAGDQHPFSEFGRPSIKRMFFWISASGELLCRPLRMWKVCEKSKKTWHYGDWTMLSWWLATTLPLLEKLATSMNKNKCSKNILIGGWATPLKNMSSSVGMIIPNISQYMEK